MTLGRKTALGILVTLAVLLPVSLFVSSRIVLGSFARAEEQVVRRHVERLQQVVAAEAEALEVLTADWGAWNDTYAFLGDRNAAYQDANLKDNSIANLRIDVMVFADTKGGLVFGVGFDRLKGEHTELPKGLAQYLRRPDGRFAGINADTAFSGILQLPEGSLLLAAHAVRRTDEKGAARGVVVFGRWLREPLIERLEKIMRLPVTIERLDAATPSAKFARAGALLVAGADVVQQEMGRDQMAAFCLLNDLQDRPVLVARIELSREIYREGRVSLLNLAIWLLISALALAGVTLFLLRKLVLDRLSALMTGVGRIHSQADLSARLPAAGNDELSRLAGAINEMFASLEKSEEHEIRVDAALALAKERLAVTLGAIGEGVIATDLQGRVVLMNKAAEGLTGWFTNEADGMPLWKIFRVVDNRADQQPALQDLFNRTVSGRSALPLPAAALMVSRNGMELGVAGNFAPVVDAQGVIVGTVLVFRDSTGEQRVEAERQRANKLESVGLLAGGIAHDFNNALTSILANNSLAALCAAGDAELRGYLLDTEKACLRARALTHQLLTFARGGAPVKNLADLGALVHEAGGFATRGSNVRCHVEIAPGLWPAEVDEGQIVQVIQNLVINAVQAMPAGGNVHITAVNLPAGEQPAPLPPGSYVAIEVRDEGPGIPTENLLGLATAYSIVHNHGGHITARNGTGGGAMLTVYLPASPDGELEGASPDTGGWSGHGRILIMDDDAITLRAIQAVLKKLGYDAVGALDGQSAIDAFAAALKEGTPFDAVIMDLTVPAGMGGREAAQHLLALHPRARLIVSSGCSNDPVMAEHDKHGFCAVLPKPFTISDLSALLRKIIAGQPGPAAAP